MRFHRINKDLGVSQYQANNGESIFTITKRRTGWEANWSKVKFVAGIAVPDYQIATIQLATKTDCVVWCEKKLSGY